MSAIDISPDFFWPFYEGLSLNADVPYGFQVAINGRGYIIDPTKYRRTTIQAIRQPVDQSVEPGEQTLNSEGLWRRGQENWVLGAGQEYLDNRASQFDLFTRAGENQSIRYRFWKSKGVNVWAEGHLTLLPECEKKRTSAATDLSILTVGQYFYLSDGVELYWTIDPTPLSPTWTAAGIAAGGADSDIVSIATDGAKVWALLADKRVQETVAGASTSTNLATLTGTNPGVIGYANGRLVASIDNLLYEVARAGTLTQIGNPANNNPSFTWTSIIGAPNAIYAAGYAGTQGEIYSITIDTTTTALTQPVWASGLPIGEIPYALMFDGGFVVIGTSEGIRLSDITRGDNGLVYGPVILVPGGTRCLTTYGEYCWFGWTNMVAPVYNDPSSTVTSTGLGRVDLGRFTSNNIPAYASDAMATDGVSGTVLSVASFNGRRYFTVSGNGLWGENAKQVSHGLMQSGLIRFSTTEPKVIAAADSRFNPLAGTVGMIVIREDGAYTTLAESDTANSFSSNLLATSLPVGESFQVQMYLKRSGVDATTGPDLRRWTVKALVTPQRMDEILLPIIMKSRVRSPLGEGTDEYFDPLTEFLELKFLESNGSIVNYQEGTSTYRVYVDRVEVQPEQWEQGNFSFFQGLIVVRLLTIPG